jgi:hypothetical protein
VIGHCHKDKCRADFCGCLCNPCLDADAGIAENYDSVVPMPESELPPVLPATQGLNATREVRDYQNTLFMIIAAGEALTIHDLPAMLDAINRAEGLGPLLNPTLFIQKSGAMSIDKALVEAAMPLWRHMKERKEEIMRRALEGGIAS